MRKIIATAVAGLCAFALPSESRSTMLASWYGPGFHGRTTANGERYDMHGLTAAHKNLPFGTKLRVCYQGCVDVRVNDRGALTLVPVSLICRTEQRKPSECLVSPGVANVEVTYL